MLLIAAPARAAGPALDEFFVDLQQTFNNGGALSGDGTVLSGSVVALRYTMPVLWDLTAPGAPSVLLRGPAEATLCMLYQLSRDGRFGAGMCGMGDGHAAPFRIHADGTYEALPKLFPEGHGVARDLSDDGSVVVGYNFDSGDHPHSVYWRGSTVHEILGLVSTGGSVAVAVSGDGRVIAGTTIDSTRTGSDRPYSYRWTWSGRAEGEGTFDRIDSLPGYNGTEVTDLSRDGKVVVGNLIGPVQGAFRWTLNSGTVNIGALEPGGVVSALATNATGAVIVGSAFHEGGLAAFRWSVKTGMQTVEAWLRHHGMAIADGITEIANAVSDDGSMVSGLLRNGHLFIARAAPDPDDMIADDSPDPRSTAEEPPRLRTDPSAVGWGEQDWPVFLDIQDYAASVPDLAGLWQGEASLAGDPLRGLPPPGRCGADQRGETREETGGEGAGRRYAVTVACSGEAGALRFGLATGASADETEFSTTDRTRHSFSLEWTGQGAEGAVFSAGLALSAVEARFARFYRNGGTPMRSDGTARGVAQEARLRLDLPGAAALGPVALTPHLSARLSRLALSDGRETGGVAPADWDWTPGLETDLEAGLTAEVPLGEHVRLVAHGAAAFVRGAPASVSVRTLGLPLQVERGKDNGWDTRLSADLGAEIDSGPGTLYAGASLSYRGGETGLGLFAGLRVAF